MNEKQIFTKFQKKELFFSKLTIFYLTVVKAQSIPFLKTELTFCSFHSKSTVQATDSLPYDFLNF